MKLQKAIRLCSAASAAYGLSLSVSAVAQTTPASQPARASSSEADTAQIADIVVTAQRREQSLQQVPIAVTAVTGDVLVSRGITDLTGLSALSPGLNLTIQAGNPRVFLRGVGGPAANGIDPSTAIFVDDVYQGGSSNLWHLDDVSRIEVLKGPQGTLFGRNATAGVIQVFTRGPTQDPHVLAKAGYESFDTIYGSAFASGGLTDTLAVSLSAQGKKQNDGWTRNITVNKDTDLGKSYVVRPKLLWTPDADTNVLLGGEISYADYNQGLNYSPVQGTITAGGAVYTGGSYATQTGIVGVNERRNRYLYLKADHDFGPVELISISAYRHNKVDFSQDLDSGPPNIQTATFAEKIDTFTQEVRLQSGKGSTLFGKDFSWTVGGFYLHSKDEAVLNFSGSFLGALGATGLSTVGDQKTNSISVFADATLEILPRTELSLGGRYNHDKLSIVASRTLVTSAGTATSVTPNAMPDITFKETSYRAVLNHHFSDDILGYVSYARGYKPGGYGLLSPTAAPVKPEILRSIEVGFKSTLFDRKLLLNAAAFSYRYSNLQVNVLGSSNTIQTINAASARVKGFEANLEARPVRNLSLTAALSVLDGEYRDFKNGPLFKPRPATCASVPPYPAPTGGFVACPADLSGNDLINAPRYQIDFGVNYTVPLAEGNVELSANYSLTDKFQWWPDNNPRLVQPRVGLINASISWALPGDRIKVQGYVRNLTNKRRPASTNESASNWSYSLAEPRVFGAFVQYSF